MPSKHLAPLLLAALALPAFAQTAEEPKPANEQVIVPQVERREVRLPKLPSNDIELGLYTGWYATQNFGTSTVTGVRLGYHLTEDLFVESVYGRTTVSDETFRTVLPAGLLKSAKEYLIGGVGSTKFAEQRRQTFNFGLGGRVLLADWAAVQMDVRDHVFKLDLLGQSKTTHNIEWTAGLTFFF
jgi:hypothetical protein